MSRKLFAIATTIILALFSTGCITTTTAIYKSLVKTEDDYKKYFSDNIKQLDPIEGIWEDIHAKYRAAIVRDMSASPARKYIAVSLENSQLLGWSTGKVKMEIELSGQEGIYQGVYHNGDSKTNIKLIMRSQGILEIPSQGNAKLSFSSFVKTYPKFDRDAKTNSTGTGFFVSNAGHLLTAGHVANFDDTVDVTLSDGSKHRAKLVKYSKSLDASLLKIDQPAPECLPLKPVGTLAVGDRLFTVGFPTVKILGEEPKYTEGVVTSLTGIKNEATEVQISVQLQPGNSGGPLVDDKGNAAGIAVSSINQRYFENATGVTAQDVNYAKNMDYVRALLVSGGAGECGVVNPSAPGLVRTQKAVVFVEVNKPDASQRK